jgi:hypothetical protein
LNVSIRDGFRTVLDAIDRRDRFVASLAGQPVIDESIRDVTALGKRSKQPHAFETMQTATQRTLDDVAER